MTLDIQRGLAFTPVVRTPVVRTSVVRTNPAPEPLSSGTDPESTGLFACPVKGVQSVSRTSQVS
ncbi:hypothetical protein GCM10010431_32960 [Streptomyces kunmingensis]